MFVNIFEFFTLNCVISYMKIKKKAKNRKSHFNQVQINAKINVTKSSMIVVQCVATTSIPLFLPFLSNSTKVCCSQLAAVFATVELSLGVC